MLNYGQNLVVYAEKRDYLWMSCYYLCVMSVFYGVTWQDFEWTQCSLYKNIISDETTEFVTALVITWPWNVHLVVLKECVTRFSFTVSWFRGNPLQLWITFGPVYSQNVYFLCTIHATTIFGVIATHILIL